MEKRPKNIYLAKKLDKKQKKKLSKSLWESTQIIDPKDLEDLADLDESIDSQDSEILAKAEEIVEDKVEK